jgi:MFS family permease
LAKSLRENRIFYGWFVLAATFFAMFMVTGARNGFGTFIIPMGDELQWDRGTISLAIAIGWLCNGVSQPFLGRLYDRYGGRTVISVSLLVVGTCTMVLSLVNDVSVFGLFVLDRFWFLVGIYGFVISVASGGASLVTIHAVLARWFSRKRGLAISISTAGASAGSLVLVPFAAYMIELAGWRNTWIILGAFVVFFALPLAWMLVRNDPSEMGEQQDGDAAPGEGGAGRANAARRGPLEVDYWRDALKSAPIWQLTGAYFVCGMTTAIISAHYIPFAVEKGIDPRVAALAFGMMSALNIAGVLAAGWISDKVGRKNVLAFIYAGRGLAYVALLTLPGAWGIWIFAVVAGFSWIASAALTSSLTADIYGLRTMGTLGGTSTFAHQIGGAVSIYLGGALFDLFGSYTVPFTIAGSLLIGATVAAFSIREKKYSAKFQTAPSQQPLPTVAGG